MSREIGEVLKGTRDKRTAGWHDDPKIQCFPPSIGGGGIQKHQHISWAIVAKTGNNMTVPIITAKRRATLRYITTFKVA